MFRPVHTLCATSMCVWFVYSHALRVSFIFYNQNHLFFLSLSLPLTTTTTTTILLSTFICTLKEIKKLPILPIDQLFVLFIYFHMHKNIKKILRKQKVLYSPKEGQIMNEFIIVFGLWKELESTFDFVTDCNLPQCYFDLQLGYSDYF